MAIANTQIGELLRRTLEERGITQVDAAEQLGCTRQTLQHWLRGFTVPDFNRVPSLVALTGQAAATVVEALLADNGIDAEVDAVAAAIPGYLNRGIPEAA